MGNKNILSPLTIADFQEQVLFTAKEYYKENFSPPRRSLPRFLNSTFSEPGTTENGSPFGICSCHTKIYQGYHLFIELEFDQSYSGRHVRTEWTAEPYARDLKGALAKPIIQLKVNNVLKSIFERI